MGLEAYMSGDIDGFDWSEEIKAYETTHHELRAARDALAPDVWALLDLTVDYDLTSVGTAHLIPRLFKYFEKTDPDVRLVISLSLNIDFHCLADQYPTAIYRIDKKFHNFTVKRLAYSPPAQDQVGDVVLDTAAAKALNSPEPWRVSIMPRNREIVVIGVGYEKGHFSHQIARDFADKAAARGFRPVFIAESSGILSLLRGWPYPVVDLLTISAPDQSQAELVADSLTATMKPYDWLIQSEGWRKRFVEQLRRVAQIRTVFEFLRPSGVITFYYGGLLGRAIQFCAAEIGISPLVPFLMLLANHARSYPLYDRHSKFLLYGSEVDDMMRGLGIPDRQRCITGNPRYDSLPIYKARREACRQEIVPGLPKDKILLLIATTGLMNLDIQWLDEACRVTREQNIEVVIKPHPSRTNAEFARWVEPHAHVHIYRQDLSAAATACDVMATDFSTTGWEAILFNKPLIIVNFSDIELSYRWEDQGVGVRVNNGKELAAQLHAVSNGTFSPDVLETQRKYAYRINYLCDGKALDRILDQTHNRSSDPLHPASTGENRPCLSPPRHPNQADFVLISGTSGSGLSLLGDRFHSSLDKRQLHRDLAFDDTNDDKLGAVLHRFRELAVPGSGYGIPSSTLRAKDNRFFFWEGYWDALSCKEEIVAGIRLNAPSAEPPRCVGTKSRDLFGEFYALHDIFSNPKLLLLVRDPRDVYASNARRLERDTPTKNMTILASMANLYRFLDICADDPSVKAVKYEALVSDPASEMSKVLGFLGLESDGYDWDVLGGSEIPSTSIYGESHGTGFTKDQDITTGNVDRFSGHLQPFDIYCIERLFQAHMVRYGYPLSNIPVESDFEERFQYVFLPTLLHTSQSQGFSIDGLLSLGLIEHAELYMRDIERRTFLGKVLHRTPEGYWDYVNNVVTKWPKETVVMTGARHLIAGIVNELKARNWLEAEKLAGHLVCGIPRIKHRIRITRSVLRAQNDKLLWLDYKAWSKNRDIPNE
ncbi:MAG: sulfotransferase [Rhodospirillum sp.]|nr:sulfotransferase [Rhodospirillum sp.]MCF8489111.1 sulfotransferase [Rhodospirillum sp.]MCF8498901.1 sulfotransferase [Rhodospirillum sp.]